MIYGAVDHWKLVEQGTVRKFYDWDSAIEAFYALQAANASAALYAVRARGKGEYPVVKYEPS